ncbi:hypothetical protein SLS62_000077 [Diatrype stigma]|uniref:Glycosyltransferase 2 n=1 Tax=Diatrype stigma TaxID=117547 RepID=A0AAN9YX43_9PEZI
MRNPFLSDVELGKKDDDHNKRTKDGGSLLPPSTWLPSRGPRRRSLKGGALLALFVLLVYLFVKNMPAGTGPNPLMRRPSYFDHPSQPPPPHLPPGQQRPPVPPAPQAPNSNLQSSSQSSPASGGVSERAYNGPVKFLELASSLHAIAPTKGSNAVNKNVLFAASSLRSAAALLPVACQMGTELKNYVHFALMSRSDIDLAELQKLNGIDDSCHLIFHDARTEHASISTDARMENAVFRALHHIHMYMHPQAIIVDASSDEEVFLGRGAQQHVKVTGNTLIELPKNSGKALEWMTKLDSVALRAWNDIQIDILINVTPKASGSLIRLLRSLTDADYTASSVPHLTLELPPDVDAPTKNFLESFSWPPSHIASATQSHLLTVRHRIPRQVLTEEESSARILESFWPTHPKTSHVLVLSPQAELSPLFFHYLKYASLQYKDAARLFGISLEQPTRLLDEKESLSLPTQPTDGDSNAEAVGGGGAPTPFLWQAPSSNAVLYMGEKWMELHQFVSRSLAAQRDPASTPALLQASSKVVSRVHPSWLEHALRLARLRGYYTLYPGAETARNLATVHGELYTAPEEYAGSSETSQFLPDDATEEEVEAARARARGELESDLVPTRSLLESLPKADPADSNGAGGPGLRSLNKLPLLAWDGRRAADLTAIDEAAARYAAEFREQVGGCGASEKDVASTMKDLLIQDLFCVAK